MRKLSSGERDRLKAILDFWRMVECFTPYDLTQNADSQTASRLPSWLTSGMLAGLHENLPLPEIDQTEREISGFRLFVGVFDQSEIDRLSRDLRQSGQSEFEESERREPSKAKSCFASFRLDAQGRLNWEEFALSMAPWALGRLEKRRLRDLNYEGFEAGREDLSLRLRNLRTRLQARRKAEAEGDPPFSGEDLLELHQELLDWAGFAPQPDALGGLPPVALLEILLKKSGASASSAEEDEADILNSFYLGDLEAALRLVASGRAPEALAAYLTPLAPQERIDFYAEAGRRELVEILRPRRMNRGRWLSDPRHAMSLMQQAAINGALEGLRAQDGIFSVNGPPGTGKTTLLRDVIAENIVARARELAALRRAEDAFDGTLTIHYGDEQTKSIARLKETLAGFEMVVASSNNAAVENISRDLPKAASIHAESRFFGEEASGESAGYLRSVARRLAAQERGASLAAPSAEEETWGLISCALGNKKNRQFFRERAFLGSKPKKGEEAAPPPEGAPLLQSFWEWRKSYSGPSFAETVRAFKAKEAEAEQAVQALERLAQAYDRTQAGGSAEQAALAAAEGDLARLQAGKAEREGRLAALRRDLENLREEERLLDRAAPGWLKKLTAGAESRAHAEQVAENARRQIEARRLLSAEEEGGADEASARNRVEQALRAARALEAERRAAEAELAAQAAAAPPPKNLADLESDEFQKSGLWRSEELARLRAQLMAAALKLHEAWLIEATKQESFRLTLFALSDLLNDKKSMGRDAPEALLAIWRALFFVTPVVSSTFASFARQFKGLGPGSLGWLFVDEAGQAVPQAAVGALMRARRALVIGDPLQIEPVFTLSGALTTALAELSPHTEDGRWSPNQTSVQALADAANRYGAQVEREEIGEALWIGSPLRVHRRCMDPMFGVANRIAYQDKMVFGGGDRRPKPEEERLHYGPSCWIDLGGEVSGKQSVPAQNEFVARILLQGWRKDGKWPPVYVITPFKEIAWEIKETTRRIADEAGTPLSAEAVKALKARVGTVHTFQGKEEQVVFMVLGADAAHRGAASWAASRPNLLNVALTRAKKRFYMVGDFGLWSAPPYFREAAAALPVLTEAAFLAPLGASEDQKPGFEEAEPEEALSPELEALRILLAEAVQGAGSWTELQAALARSDLGLAPRGGGLILRNLGDGASRCKASELGFGYYRLIRRFREGFPGHPQRGLAERILGQGAAPK